MKAENSLPVAGSQAISSAIRQRARQIAGLMLFQAAVLVLSSGTWTWRPAWAYLGLYSVVVLVNAIVLLSRNPATIAERARGGPGVKRWDRLVGGLFALTYFLVILLVGGLDERYGWTPPVPAWFNLLGAVLFLAGSALFSWAMAINPFFSTTVRLQHERGHVVVTQGPYRLLRHPGYLGALAQALGVPLLLGSLWALVPGALACILLGIRTTLEDQALQQELAGYHEYAQQVPFRLLPGLW